MAGRDTVLICTVSGSHHLVRTIRDAIHDPGMRRADVRAGLGEVDVWKK